MKNLYILYIRLDLENARYVATHDDFQDFIAYSNNTRILGTNSWTLINDSKVSKWIRNIKYNFCNVDRCVQILKSTQRQ